MSKGLPKGFTLIEVLIAAVVLFSVLSTGLMAFQTAMGSSERATRVLHLTKVAMIAQSNVEHNLFQGIQPIVQHSYQGGFTLFEVDVAWQADKVAAGAPPAVEELDGILTQHRDRFFLFNVTLHLNYGSLQRDYHYQELVWLPSLQEI